MHENDDLAIEETERHQPFLAVTFSDVFTGNGELVPNGVCVLEVQAMQFDVATAFGFIPGRHATNCNNNLRQCQEKSKARSNVHSEPRAPLLRASDSAVLLGASWRAFFAPRRLRPTMCATE